MLLYVGRFTEVKRVPLLIEAYARARPGFRRRAPLVLVGGFPGEWEGEHPLRRDRAHRRAGRLPRRLARATTSCRDFLAASDVVVLPSVREQFGQVLVEGMACGLPAIAVDAHGPAEIVDARRDRLAGRARRRATALADALVEAVNRPDERRRRGDRGRARRARALRLAGARRARWPRSTTTRARNVARRPTPTA